MYSSLVNYLTRDITDSPLCVKLPPDDVHCLVEVIERPNPRDDAEEVIEEHAQIPLVLGTLPFSRKLAQLVKFRQVPEKNNKEYIFRSSLTNS